MGPGSGASSGSSPAVLGPCSHESPGRLESASGPCLIAPGAAVVEAAEAKIQRVLEGSRQFLVPHFQRPYSWREKQWDALWRDLVDLVETPSAEPHFVGSIVSSPARTVPEGVEKRLLIDGQQRLTTLLILLALVRDRAIDTAVPRLADRIQDLITNRHEEGHDRYKLLPTQGDSARDSDREAFAALVDRRPMESTSGIMAAANHLRAKLMRADAPPIEELFRAATARLTLVSIILDDKDNPHRIFESLNGKGRPLSQADLIRNYFFMRIAVGQHERVYRTLWQPMQRRLGEDVLTEFVRHYLMRQGAVINESDVYATLKQRIESSGVEVEVELERLCTHARYYEVLLDPSRAPTAALRERLERLRRLELTVVFPFLLPLYGDFAEGRVTEGDLCAILDVVETYVIRRFVCGVATHGLNKVFAPLYQQVSRGGSLLDATRNALASRGCPSDAQFRERLGSTRLYGGGERRERTKLLLERLEHALGHKERVTTEPLSIEHVLPQTASAWWREHLGDGWEEAHEDLVHTLGNLTLTNYNSELSNDSYPEKQALLARSHVELNRYFATTERWDAAEIERRADVLSDLALNVWPWFGPQAGITPERSDEVTSTLPLAVVFRGTELPVRSWAEVLVTTLDLLCAALPDQVAALEAALPRLLSRDPSAFRNARRVRRLASGLYVETNLSATGIHRACLQALEALAVEPADWNVRRVSLLASGEENDLDAPSDVKQLQADWWTELRVSLEATGEFASLRAVRPRHWFDIAVGRSGFRIALVANVTQSRFEVRLLSTDTDPIMERLFAERSTIEAEIGVPLEWEAPADIRRRTIRAARAVRFRERAEWPAAIAWATELTVAFKRVFVPRLASAAESAGV